MSCILQAVKCHAVSNAKKAVAKPIPMYAIFSKYILPNIFERYKTVVENIEQMTIIFVYN